MTRPEPQPAATRRPSRHTPPISPHTRPILLATARQAPDTLPAARYIDGWRALLDGLTASHTEIIKALDRPAAPGTPAEREQRRALWPHLAVWADHGSGAASLAEQLYRSEVPLTDEEARVWTQRAQSALARGKLHLIEAWYAADGRHTNLAYLVEDDASTVIALSGDPDAPAGP